MSQTTPSPKPTPTQTQTKTGADYLKGGPASTGGATGTGTPLTTSGSSILWQEAFPTPMGYQKGSTITKTQAKAAYKTGSLTAIQKSIIDRGYQSYKAQGGKSSQLSWYNAYVDSASGTTTPFQLINTQYGLGETPAGYTLGTTDAGPGTGSSTNVSVSMYSRPVADSIIDAAILSTYGRQATQAERDSFFTEYTNQAKAGTVTKTYRKGGKTYTETTQMFNEKDFQKKFTTGILNQALATDDGADLSGEAGALQDQLRTAANDMALIMSDSQINSYVRRVFNNEMTADDALGQFRDQAMVLYQPYAEQLKADPTLTVRKLANPYLQLIADRWEMTNPNEVSMTDPLLQKFISGKYSLADADKEVKQTAKYRNSMAAQKEASNVGSLLASAMGF